MDVYTEQIFQLFYCMLIWIRNTWFVYYIFRFVFSSFCVFILVPLAVRLKFPFWCIMLGFLFISLLRNKILQQILHLTGNARIQHLETTVLEHACILCRKLGLISSLFFCLYIFASLFFFFSFSSPNLCTWFCFFNVTDSDLYTKFNLDAVKEYFFFCYKKWWIWLY